MLKSFLLVYPHQQALSGSLTHSPPLGLSRGKPVPLGIHSAFSDFRNHRQREPDLCVVLRGTDLGTSRQGLPMLYPAAQQMGLSQTPRHGIQAWAGWAVKALCIH